MVPAGAVNVLRLLAVKDAGLVRVATRSPGSLSALFFLILTLVLLPEVNLTVYQPRRPCSHPGWRRFRSSELRRC